MRRVYICVMIAAMVAILFSQIRFLREAFEPTRDPAPVGSYAPERLSDPGIEKPREANRPRSESRVEPEEVPIQPAED